jgi:hypothetical protein
MIARRAVRRLLIVAAVLAGSAIGSSVHAQTAGEPAMRRSPPSAPSGGAVRPPPRPSDAASAPSSAAVAPVPVAPRVDKVLQQAGGAGAGTCRETLGRMTSRVLDAPHEAFSTWSAAEPDARGFQSVVVSRYESPVAPRAASVFFAAPTGVGRCDGMHVEIFPTGRSCADVEATLRREGRVLVDLGGHPVIEDAAGTRHVLLNSAGSGCVIIASGVTLPR